MAMIAFAFMGVLALLVIEEGELNEVEEGDEESGNAVMWLLLLLRISNIASPSSSISMSANDLAMLMPV
jgi:hypothetical protein